MGSLGSNERQAKGKSIPKSQGGMAHRGSGRQRRESSDKGGVTRNEHQGQEGSTPFTLGTPGAHCTMTQRRLWAEGWLQFRNFFFWS